MTAEKSSHGIGITALILGVLLFSTVEVASKMMQQGGGIAGNNPFWIACFRSIMTGLIFVAPARKSLRRRGTKLAGRDVWILSGVGLIGVTLMSGLFHVAITCMQANIAALIFSCNPVFVVLFAALFLSEKITLRKVGALSICVVGMTMLGINRAAGISVIGLILMVGSTLTFALYTVFCKKIIPRYGALPVTAFTSLIGGMMLLPIALVAEGVPFATYGWVDWAGLFYLAIFGTAMGYFLYIYGIGHVSAGLGSMVFFLKPFSAALFAWLVLNEKFSAPELVAGACILAGMVIALAPVPARR